MTTKTFELLIAVIQTPMDDCINSDTTLRTKEQAIEMAAAYVTEKLSRLSNDPCSLVLSIKTKP